MSVVVVERGVDLTLKWTVSGTDALSGVPVLKLGVPGSTAVISVAGILDPQNRLISVSIPAQTSLAWNTAAWLVGSLIQDNVLLRVPVIQFQLWLGAQCPDRGWLKIVEAIK